LRYQDTIAAAALALAVSSGAANASNLYGATYTAVTSDLYSIDQTTGAATLIGATGKNIGDTELGDLNKTELTLLRRDR